jgi:hypothetical protein
METTFDVMVNITSSKSISQLTTSSPDFQFTHNPTITPTLIPTLEPTLIPTQSPFDFAFIEKSAVVDGISTLFYKIVFFLFTLLGYFIF